jgi:hypothetical protein
MINYGVDFYLDVVCSAVTGYAMGPANLKLLVTSPTVGHAMCYSSENTPYNRPKIFFAHYIAKL